MTKMLLCRYTLWEWGGGKKKKNLGTSNRIPTRGAVVMYTSCHGATIVITNCTIISHTCSSACYHGIWHHNSTNSHHNSSIMTTCNRKYKCRPCIQQQILFEVLKIVLLVNIYNYGWPPLNLSNCNKLQYI